MSERRLSNKWPGWLPTTTIICVVVAIAVGGGTATDTGSTWYAALVRPTWQPPNWLFAPVWTTVYLLLALSAIIVYGRSTGTTRRRLMALYGLNGVLNLSWTWIFFQGHSPLWAGIDIIALWVTIAGLMIGTRPVSRAASWMLAPYLLWVSFASILNWSIVRLN